jgi:hypothetical protein
MLPSAIAGLKLRMMVELFLMSSQPPEATLCEGEEENFVLVVEYLSVH